MKTELTKTPEQEFKPFSVTLTFESMDEVLEMYARANTSILSLKGSGYGNRPIEGLDSAQGLHSILQLYLRENYVCI